MRLVCDAYCGRVVCFIVSLGWDSASPAAARRHPGRGDVMRCDAMGIGAWMRGYRSCPIRRPVRCGTRGAGGSADGQGIVWFVPSGSEG